jgi:hypothetical protein
MRVAQTGAVTPLDVLLSHAVLALTRQAEALEPSLDVVRWADFLRVADGLTQKTMHLDARVSKRAITSHSKLSTRSGWLTIDDGVCRLTADGRAVRDSWGAAIASAGDGFEALRPVLTPVVAALDLELPHFIHPYGTPDPSITGGRPHGADWKPVRRDRDADTTSSLSMLALLSQALTAYSIAYEQHAGPMVWGVYLARHPDAPLPFAGTFTRHRFNAKRLRDAYAPVTAAIEASWSDAPALRRALESLDFGEHADHPHVSFSAAVGFVEISGRAGRAPG